MLEMETMTTTKKPTIEEYWRDLAQPWENASYEGDTSKLSFIERIATYGRQHIHHRKETAIEILKPFVKGKVILDIGCAGGIFEMDLLRHGAADVTGVDVSASAIDTASARAKSSGMQDRAHFLNCKIDGYTKYAGKKIDILTGLGILEYLRPELIRDLVNFVKPKDFVLLRRKGVHAEERRSLRVSCRQTDAVLKKFRADEMAQLLAGCGYSPVEFKREHANSFVHFLPQDLAKG